MRKSEKKKRFTLTNEEDDEMVRCYETMPLESVRAELEEAGIDSRPTIKAVKALIREHWRALHQIFIASPAACEIFVGAYVRS